MIFGNSKKEFKALSFEVERLRNLSNLNTAIAIGANINRSIAVFPADDIGLYAERYTTTDDLHSIIHKIANAAALVPLYPYEVKPDIEAQKSYTKLRKITLPHLSVKKYQELQEKSLADLPDSDKLAEILESPHADMSKYEFRYALHTFLLSCGECILLKKRPTVGVNKGLPIQLEFLFPQFAQHRISETLPRRIVGWDYRIDGVLVYENIQPEDIIHIKYFNPSMDLNGTELRGLSPIKILKRRLTRLDANMNVSVAQMQNGGVPGILFQKNLDPSAKEVLDARKVNMQRYFQRAENKGMPYNAAGELDYIELGLKLADMQVAELANIDFKKVCNVFSVSDRLFNNDATGSEVSDDNAQRGLYTDAVLPNVYRERDGLKKGLLADLEQGVLLTERNEQGDLQPLRIKGDGKKRDIREDLSEITVLQDDMAKQATALNTAYWLTPNEKREAMKYDRLEDAAFDQPLLPAGLQTLEDMKAIEPINNEPGD